MAFVPRNLSFKFQRQAGTGTSANGSDTVTIPPGLMASVRFLNAGLFSMGHCQMTIWGLTQSIMSDLSTLGVIVRLQPSNVVTVYATDEQGGLPQIFKGEIWQAIPDYNRQPEAPIWIDAYSGLGIAVGGATPQSAPADIDVVVTLAKLCKAAGYNFEPNNTPTQSLGKQYLYGSFRDQILTIINAVQYRGIAGAFVEDNTVAIWPTTAARGGIVPMVSAGTPGAPGTLIGYPSYTNSGINFRCLYNPNIRFGAQVQVETSLPLASINVPGIPSPASGKSLWNVYGLSHNLDSQIPGGKWETLVEATRAGYPSPVIATATG
jgi:hypothetical protein